MHEPRADRLGPDKFYKGSSQGKPGTDGKFRVLGSATELPRVATPVLVCELLSTTMVEKRPTFDKVAENGPPVPGFRPRLLSSASAGFPASKARPPAIVGAGDGGAS